MQTVIGFDVKLLGCDGGSTKIKFVITSNGSTDSFCDDELYSSGSTASCQQTAIGDITENKYTVKVYDSKGNLIRQASGYPKE